jgi:hypothetical protein
VGQGPPAWRRPRPGHRRRLIEPLPGGWLVRPAAGDDERGDAESATSVLLDLHRPAHVVLTVRGPSGAWEHRLSPRHAEIGHARPAYRLARTQPVNK